MTEEKKKPLITHVTRTHWPGRIWLHSDHAHKGYYFFTGLTAMAWENGVPYEVAGYKLDGPSSRGRVWVNRALGYVAHIDKDVP